MFIKFIAHDLKCNIIVFDLFNNTVQICSGNILKQNNVKFDSPLLLYTTGSHFQSVVPQDHEFFMEYANELCRSIKPSTDDQGLPTQDTQENSLQTQWSKPLSAAERKRKSRESLSAERKLREDKKDQKRKANQVEENKGNPQTPAERKKPMTSAERKRKSREAQSEEKKKEDAAKDQQAKAKQRAGR